MLTPEAILALVPQKPPFRFLDRITRIDEESAAGEYTFRGGESFYTGHFPGNPLTPGVILLEAMCQTGLVALGLFLLSREHSLAELEKHVTLFSDAQVEFLRPVRPGERVRIEARRLYYRHRKLRSAVKLLTESGDVASEGVVSGTGVRRDELPGPLPQRAGAR